MNQVGFKFYMQMPASLNVLAGPGWGMEGRWHRASRGSTEEGADGMSAGT